MTDAVLSGAIEAVDFDAAKAELRRAVEDFLAELFTKTPDTDVARAARRVGRRMGLEPAGSGLADRLPGSAVLPRPARRGCRPTWSEAAPSAGLPRDRPETLGGPLPPLRRAERRKVGWPRLVRLERPEGCNRLRGGGGGRASLLRAHPGRRAGTRSRQSAVSLHAVGRRILCLLRRGLLERLPRSCQRLLPAAREGGWTLKPYGGSYSARRRRRSSQVPEPKAARRLAGSGRHALILDLHAVALAGRSRRQRCPDGAANR